MKKFFLKILFSSTITFSYIANPMTLGSVNVILRANLIEKGCDISVGSDEQFVDLGSWASSYFYFAGRESRKIPFSITLENCENISQIKLTLLGKSNAIDSTLLSTTLGSSVGILLTDSSGMRLPVGRPKTYNISNSITGAKVILNFNAQYKALVIPVMTGNANADSVIAIDYI
ncbi:MULTISPECIES: fimbrial protein [Enterobacter]|uniref:Fimbrial-type adhesion domain-containing protein n=2 Tax=Enterobacteriaceae TaxID=543 RepID=A0A1S6XXR2_ENTCL|nr:MULTISPECIES: fimbrial protein [Enterobacter]AQX35138.1 hypothetical protein PIMI6_00180 [Enterobacter cloacae]MDH1548081.1 type 1 fimbrial protein [Enterobacter ludwigii]